MLDKYVSQHTLH